MSRSITLIVVAILAFVAIVAAFSALFTVHQTQQAIVLQFGNPKRVVKEPGLHVKLPFIQDVVYFDNRVLDFAPPAEELIVADQKRVVVDAFARFRIVDPLLFYQTVVNEVRARSQLSGVLVSSLRRIMGNETLSSVLSEERAGIMLEITEEVTRSAKNFGIDVIDVRIRRADLPPQNAEAIYQRMQSEREREAREFRAQGAELAQRIRARAERERTVLIAEAERQAQVLRGQGDGEAIRIYAEAFGRDPDFFAFYRSMQAYREALGGDTTTMVLSPSSDFFRYFDNLRGVAADAQQPSDAAAPPSARPAPDAAAPSPEARAD